MTELLDATTYQIRDKPRRDVVGQVKGIPGYAEILLAWVSLELDIHSIYVEVTNRTDL